MNIDLPFLLNEQTSTILTNIHSLFFNFFQMLGRNIALVDCHSHTDLSSISLSLLTGALLSGSILCFENANRLALSQLSAIADSFRYIQDGFLKTQARVGSITFLFSLFYEILFYPFKVYCSCICLLVGLSISINACL